MAFNLQTFKTRTLTAIVFAAVMLAGLFINHWTFLILFSIIHFGCWWEYLRLGEKIFNNSFDKFIKYFFCISGYLVFLAAGYCHYNIDFFLIVSGMKLSFKWGLIFLFIICMYAFLFQNKKLPGRQKWFVTAGLIYISLTLGLMINLYRPVDIHIYDTMYVLAANTIPLFLIITIWINDTLSYLVGSWIGKTPLSKISPRKTWEGTVGGAVLAVVVAGLAGWQFNFPVIIVMIAAGIIAIAGIFGDLLESKLKRMAGVKDSGSLMPGHGGFLDRFDSMLLAVPALWLLVFFLAH
jgi:phosphatidate cytidylyltransferase